MAKLEDNPIVKEFEEQENPPKGLVIHAYLIRDEFYNITDEEVISKGLKKLYGGYVEPHESVREHYHTLMLKLPFEEFLVEMDKYIQNKKESIEKFNVLKELTKSEDFYNGLDISELYSLGW